MRQLQSQWYSADDVYLQKRSDQNARIAYVQGTYAVWSCSYNTNWRVPDRQPVAFIDRSDQFLPRVTTSTHTENPISKEINWILLSIVVFKIGAGVQFSVLILMKVPAWKQLLGLITWMVRATC